jgi:two-component system OmpR family sensor kinase
MRSFTRTWSLRRRLVAIVTLVAVAALLAVDIATYHALQGSLLDRLERQVAQLAQERPPGENGDDQSLQPAPRPGPGGGAGAARQPAPQRPAAQRAAPAGTWNAVFINGAFDAPMRETVTGVTTIDRRSDIPRIHLTTERIRALMAAPEQVDSADGSTRFLVQARGLRDGDYMVVALPMTDYRTTLHRLRNIELVVSLIAALGVLLLALLTVRAGLRPLDAIAAAAADITAEAAQARIGKRVPLDAAASTEMGRLAGSLNEMLDSLDASFATQHAAQQQLRQFVSDASHELRTPLTSIQGFAELARARAADMSVEERDTALLRVEQEATHLTKLVEELLVLSRLDERLPLHTEPTDIARIAATSVDAARVIEPSRAVEFSSSGPVVVEADPVRVRQVVDNLLANARMHAGAAASVVVHVSDVGGPDPVGRITVSDDGVGMDDATRARATDRFWRADAARTRATGGSGLGLSLVRAIVDAHGGELRIEPGANGRGTCVSVDLPRR